VDFSLACSCHDISPAWVARGNDAMIAKAALEGLLAEPLSFLAIIPFVPSAGIPGQEVVL
jgi:hypothetical protein